MPASPQTQSPSQFTPAVLDWRRVAYLTLASRALDAIEETRLVPEKKVLYQFTARGHDLAQVLLGSLLTHPHDGVGAYYRSRPLMLALGLSIEDGFAGPMAKSGGINDGRDIGVVFNRNSSGGPTVLPMSGDVGSQFTPVIGWAQALGYWQSQLGASDRAGAIGVALGGDGAVATNGFWSALTIATTLQLPVLFYIEDNGYSLSVPARWQTPGANIAANLAAFSGLTLWDGDGSDPAEASRLLINSVTHVRSGAGPGLIRLRVPRLSGHSGQDTQAYKPKELIESERANDPLRKLEAYLVPERLSAAQWEQLNEEVEREVQQALQDALARPGPDASQVRRHLYLELRADGSPEWQRQGGLGPDHRFPDSSEAAQPEPQRINFVAAVRRTLESELASNPKLLVFGEDVGAKGGVHAATQGLQQAFGEARVFDTSLSEEGIIGRAVGMALAGLMPVAEIQFRKYADPATEQLNNCGTIRWRTANHFAAPIVVRMPGGFAKCGDPWHSVSGEVLWTHVPGWQVAIPSHAADAVGLLRAALRSPNPTIFFEHRHLLDAAWARRPYPGDRYLIPFGKAALLRPGSALTVVSWGAMVERCELAAEAFAEQVELLDLRTLAPWDRASVFASVQRTHRLLIVHEDGLTAGFGAEVAAAVAKHCFFSLDAPIERLAVPDIPIPYNVGLMEATVPSTDQIAAAIDSLVNA
jgi:2-oxoisovalerate dehydrogenase E1 component